MFTLMTLLEETAATLHTDSMCTIFYLDFPNGPALFVKILFTDFE